MTNTRTAQAFLALEQLSARTTIASIAADWLCVRMPAAPFGVGYGSSAPTRWRPRT
jgi:hypothetical protein